MSDIVHCATKYFLDLYFYTYPIDVKFQYLHYISIMLQSRQIMANTKRVFAQAHLALIW